MKKFLLLFTIALLCSFITHAQIKKGAIFLGGDISGRYSNTESADTSYSKTDGISVGITYGRAVRENLVFGALLSANINTSRNFYGDGTRHKASGYIAGVFLRKYKQLSNSGFYIFANSNLSAAFTKNTIDASSYSKTKRTTIAVSAYPGVSYAVSKRFQLETGFNNFVSVGYFNEKVTNKYINGNIASEFKTNGFNAGVSLDNLSSVYLGFRVLLN